VIECNFTTFTVDDSIHLTANKSSNVYGCVVVGISDLMKAEVSVNGVHANLRENDDVVGISVADKNVGDLLNNFGGVFVNVREILIRNCTINGINLNGFEKLEKLVIIGSDLEEIGGNFFEKNQNLKEVRIFKNEKLSKINQRAFSELKELKILNLNENFCSTRIYMDQSNINEVLGAIKLKCDAQNPRTNVINANSSPSSIPESDSSLNNTVLSHLHSISSNHISTNVHLALQHSKLLNESQTSNLNNKTSQNVQIITEKSLDTPQSTPSSQNSPSNSPMDLKPSTKSASQTNLHNKSTILLNSSTKFPNNPELTSNTLKSNNSDSKNPKITLSSNSNVAQSTGNSEIQKQSIDIKTNKKATSESSGNGKAIAICVMFGAVSMLMGAALYVKKRQTRIYDGVLLIDNTDV